VLAGNGEVSVGAGGSSLGASGAPPEGVSGWVDLPLPFFSFPPSPEPSLCVSLRRSLWLSLCPVFRAAGWGLAWPSPAVVSCVEPASGWGSAPSAPADGLAGAVAEPCCERPPCLDRLPPAPSPLAGGCCGSAGRLSGGAAGVVPALCWRAGSWALGGLAAGVVTVERSRSRLAVAAGMNARPPAQQTQAAAARRHATPVRRRCRIVSRAIEPLAATQPASAACPEMGASASSSVA
jgi:hypothetical protein